METTSLSFVRRSVASTGQIPVPRQGGLAIPIGDNIYYYAGRTRNNGGLDEIAGSVFHVFNTKSASWSKIETTPPHKNCGEIFIYGTAIGTDIWIYDKSRWTCFDTVKQAWRKVDEDSESWQSLNLSSIGVIGQSMYYYDGDLNSFDKKVYQLDTSTNKISTSVEEGFGDHPQDRHETYMLAISDDILMLYAPFASYDRKKAQKFGELFYYDLKEAKWARVNEPKNDPTLNLHAYYYMGRIGSSMYFLPQRDTDPNELWALNLETSTWEKKIAEGDKPKEFANYATLVGDKIYCWMSDGTMTVIDVVNMPRKDQQRQIDEKLAQQARAALSLIKRPETVIDDFVPEPIVLDIGLHHVDLNKPKIHREMVTGFDGLFPQMDHGKIIESTIAAPSNSVFMHKNYIHYLTLAWSNHFSVILSPDIIFYTVLCEIADEILTNPEAFRHLFTDSTDKKRVMTITHDPTKIDLNDLTQGIAKNLPVDASIFTADFSCSTAESRLAMQSAFCEAMSAYYFYESTECGIPRVKVLGTRQDWMTLEQKINQDGSTDQKMSLYLKQAEDQTRKIYTTRDLEFWKDMFAIDTCQSGHTDVVEGWINAYYRKGYARKENGKVKFYGDDFYNYKAHISTVKWRNVETDRHFELKSGLMYSNVVHGESQEDKNFPWLEPQFCHVIIETDGEGKMSPEAFKKYIENTLKGKDKKLMMQFYEVLKDDPMEFVKDKGPREVDFKLTLVTRLIESWKQEFLKTGQGASHFDLKSDPCAAALDFSRPIGESNQEVFTALKEKIIEYLKLNTNITQVNMSYKLANIEHDIIDVLVGNPKIEELTVFLTSQESTEKIAQLLSHPSCNLKRLRLASSSSYYYYYDDDEDDDDDDNKKKDKPDYSIFAFALHTTAAPLEELTFESDITNEEVAKAVADLCRRPNGLKRLNMPPGGDNATINEILIRGQVESKTLQEISLNDVSRKQVAQRVTGMAIIRPFGEVLSMNSDDDSESDNKSDELKELIVNSLPLNPSLILIGYFRYKMTPVELAKALSIPSLKSIKNVSLSDLSFLDVTTKLESIDGPITGTPEQMESLQKFVMREDCPLKTLKIERSTIHPGAGVILGKGLVHNKSITELNLRKSDFKSDEDVVSFLDYIAQWLEKDDCPLVSLNLAEMYNVIFEDKNLQKLLTALKNNKTLGLIFASIKCTVEDLPLVMDLVQQNSKLFMVHFSGSSNTKLSGEARDQLVAATNANQKLAIFQIPLLNREDWKPQARAFNPADYSH